MRYFYFYCMYIVCIYVVFILMCVCNSKHRYIHTCVCVCKYIYIYIWASCLYLCYIFVYVIYLHESRKRSVRIYTPLQGRGLCRYGAQGSSWESRDPPVTHGVCPLPAAGSCVRWGKPSPASTPASWKSAWPCVGLSSWPGPHSSITSW